MLSKDVIISAAGCGKTTQIINDIKQHLDEKSVVLTYTIENYKSICNSLILEFGCIPKNIRVQTWFSFLLNECVRPYQNFLYTERIDGIFFVEGISTKRIPKTSIKYFITQDNRIYTDKISEFACLCDEKSGGLVVERLRKNFSRLYIDEVQDLAGYDFDLLELFFDSDINVMVVGDNRQATFSTNNSRKYSKFKGKNIIDLFDLWEKKGKCNIRYKRECFRSNQKICDLADALYPDMPKTISKQNTNTGHDGVFYISSNNLDVYIERFKPTILRYDKRTKCEGINFGVSKGLTFDRVLIYPNGPIEKYLGTGNIEHLSGSKPKYYVAFSRARYSVSFVYDGEVKASIEKYTID